MYLVLQVRNRKSIAVADLFRYNTYYDGHGIPKSCGRVFVLGLVSEITSN
jgi:hypothetical protein